MNGCSVLGELLEATSCCSLKSLISCAKEICCTIFTQQVRAWSKSCVERVVACLLALGCYEFSAVRSDSDESVQLGEFLGDVFLRL